MRRFLWVCGGKGRAYPLTRLSLGTPASSCWTKLSERTEGKRKRIERARERERKSKWVTRGTCTGAEEGDGSGEARGKRGTKSRELKIGGKRRAELSAESSGRKTRHHRKIALSRTHLFSIPSSSWPFHPRIVTTLTGLVAFLP